MFTNSDKFESLPRLSGKSNVSSTGLLRYNEINPRLILSNGYLWANSLLRWLLITFDPFLKLLFLVWAGATFKFLIPITSFTDYFDYWIIAKMRLNWSICLLLIHLWNVFFLVQTKWIFIKNRFYNYIYTNVWLNLEIHVEYRFLRRLYVRMCACMYYTDLENLPEKTQTNL